MKDAFMQFPLKFRPNVDFRREDFMVSKCNFDAFSYVELWPNWPCFAAVLYGPEGCGKSHLAHMFAERVSGLCQPPVPVSIINAREITMSRVERIFQENFCLVIENLTPKIDNEAMFHLFNMYQNIRGGILFTAETAPARMRFELPDLQSRLNMLPAVAIAEPDDELLGALVLKLFTDRQVMISPEVLNFIIRNTQRSFSYVQKLVEEIDAISLSRKRAVSVTMVKEAMLILSIKLQPELF